MTWIKMKNIVLIIPNISKMFLISTYKLCQAPNTKKCRKEYKWRGRMALVWCVFMWELLPSIYSKAMVGFSTSAHATVVGEITRKHHVEGEARWCILGCGHTRTRGGSSRHRLRSVSSLVGLGHCYVDGWPGFARYMGLLFILLRGFCFYAFQVAHFDSISMCFMSMPCKTMILRYLWK